MFFHALKKQAVSKIDSFSQNLLILEFFRRLFLKNVFIFPFLDENANQRAFDFPMASPKTLLYRLCIDVCDQLPKRLHPFFDQQRAFVGNFISTGLTIEKNKTTIYMCYRSRVFKNS